MKFIKNNILVLLLVLQSVAIAQVNNGYVFVSNDYRSKQSDVVVVKWVANKIYYPNGFEVYRQEIGTTQWTKISKERVNVSKTPMATGDNQIKTMMDFVQKTSYPEFQESVMRVFVMIKAIKDPKMAELLGVVYYDRTAEKSKTYRYKITGVNGNKKEEINVSPYIKNKIYAPITSPKEVRIERVPSVININWTPEERRYFGVNVYRSSNGGTFKKITEQPRSIQKNKNEKGEMVYPDVCYSDLSVADSINYSYKLTAVDYFGQESGYSKIVEITSQDFDAPPAPYEVEGKVSFLDINLTWKSKLVADAVGYNVYKHYKRGDKKIKINTEVLPITQLSFQDKATEPTMIYYSIAAVDEAGNEGVSGDILVDVHDVFAPCVPTNVVVKSDTGKVILSWDNCADKDLMGYYIYKSLSDEDNTNNEFILVNNHPIVATSYEESLNKKIKNKFVYKVVSIDSTYNRSEYSILSVVKLPDVTPPLAPFIKNIKETSGDITLQWLPNHETDLEAYQVYRSSYEDSSRFELIGSLNEVEYHDKDIVTNVKYHYYLKAVDMSGNISPESNVYEGKAILKEVTEHHTENTVDGIKIKYSKKKKEVNINWNESIGLKLNGVVIYKGNANDELVPLTGLLHNRSEFLDKEVQKGSTIYYQLREYSKKGSYTKSKVYAIKIK